MKKVKIHEITCYGEYYSSHDYKIKPIYWLRLKDYKIFDVEVLIEKGKFKDIDQVIKTGKFIPFFQTDMIALYREFVQRFCPQVHQNLLKIQDLDLEYDYETAFRIYFDGDVVMDMWDAYVTDRLRKDAIQWCRENDIAFVL